MVNASLILERQKTIIKINQYMANFTSNKALKNDIR